jgi:hypothetical protein
MRCKNDPEGGSKAYLSCNEGDSLYTCRLTANTLNEHLRAKVFMVVTMKITACWDVMLCSLIDKYKHFRGKCYLHLQGRGNKTVVCMYQTTQCHIPEDSILHTE